MFWFTSKNPILSSKVICKPISARACTVRSLLCGMWFVQFFNSMVRLFCTLKLSLKGKNPSHVSSKRKNTYISSLKMFEICTAFSHLICSITYFLWAATGSKECSLHLWESCFVQARKIAFLAYSLIISWWINCLVKQFYNISNVLK